MKILYIITSLNAGGAEMMLLKIIDNIDRDSFVPVVVTLMDGGKLKGRYKKANVEIYSLGMRRGVMSILGFVKLFILIYRVKPNVIHSWMYHSNVISIVASFLLLNKYKVFWSVRHSIYNIRNEKKITRWMIEIGAKLSRLPCKILYNSEVSRLQHESIGYNSNKSLTIPNGFDLNAYRPDCNARRNINNEFIIDDKCFLVGIIGRFHPMKDHNNFLISAEKTLNKNPNIKFLMVGRDLSYDNKGLCNSINKMNLEDHVLLCGERTDIPRLMAAMDVTVLSSSSEAFPNVVGESLACGTPCITTDVGDAAYIAGNSDFVVPPRDPSSLANAIIRVLDLTSDERNELGMAARERIIKLFSIGSVVREYEKLYLKYI